MIPEGLEWKSAADILDDVASVGFNFVRMYVRSPSPVTLPEVVGVFILTHIRMEE